MLPFRQHSGIAVIRQPDFEQAAVIVSDNAPMMAELCSLFVRAGRYLAVSDGPRMAREDAHNEVVRRQNLAAMVQPRKIILLGLPPEAEIAMARNLPRNVAYIAADKAAAIASLAGQVRIPTTELRWPNKNLGIGLMIARQRRQRLVIDDALPPDPRTMVEAGKHILVACEEGDEIGQIIASNLVHSIGASLLVLDRLPKSESRQWLEELYLYRTREQVLTLDEITARASARLPEQVKGGIYSEILFVTHDFPWGLAIQNCPTSHLKIYPDLGVTIATAIWAEADASRSARTALVVDPGTAPGEDMNTVLRALARNRTLVLKAAQHRATISRVSQLIQGMPFDLIAFATHATEHEGNRVTYQYDDADGRRRTLIVDEALGIGYDRRTDLFQVSTYHHFHELDGVSWSDDAAKSALPVGSAITHWAEHVDSRKDWVVTRVPIERVVGAMVMQMFDGVWIPFLHGYPPNTAPIVLNNACNSWHRLAETFMYAGARAYIGAVVSVLGPEAEVVSSELFGAQLGKTLSTALWNAQRVSFPGRTSWPYVLFGLPFIRIRVNLANSLDYLRNYLKAAISDMHSRSKAATRDDVKNNYASLASFLEEEMKALEAQFPQQPSGRRPPR